MALRSYDDLQRAVRAWLARLEDDDIAESVPTFISLAETRFRSKLRMRQLLRRARAVLNEEAEWLPADYVEALSVVLIEPSGVKRPLQYLTPERLVAEFGGRAGNPQAYTIIGRQMLFAPEPVYPNGVDPAQRPRFEVWYYAAPAPLGPETPTNEVLDAHPDVYLYGTLLETAPYLHADARIGVWSQLYASALDAANAEAERGLHGTISIGMPA